MVKILNGTSGDDYLVARGLHAYRINAGSGDDTIIGSDFGDEIYGHYGNDRIYTGSGDDTVNAGSGADVIHLSDGNDVIDGAHGSDYIVLDNAKHSVTVDLSAGFARSTYSGDRAQIGENWLNRIENVHGSQFKDVIYGNALDNFASGRNGNDHFDLRDGDDQAYGGNGYDTFIEGRGNDYYDGGAGWDKLLLDHLSDGVHLNTASSTLKSRDPSSGFDIGDNTFQSIERFDLTQGDDYAFSKDNTRQQINLEGGNDALHVGMFDVADGGAGRDSIDFSGIAGGYFYNLYDFGTGQLHDDTGRVAVEFSNFETIFGANGSETYRIPYEYENNLKIHASGGDDTFIASGQRLNLHGDAGDDDFSLHNARGQFHGGSGHDTFEISNLHGRVSGGFGSDTFIVSSFADSPTSYLEINGNHGNDHLEFTGAALNSGVKISLGKHTTFSDNSFIAVSAVDTFKLTNHADVIVDNALFDRSMNIEAGGGDDTITIGSGRVVITGGSGDDVISTGNDNDTLNGGSGDDILTGGRGEDRFVFNHERGDFGHDTVTDFDTGANGDELFLSALRSMGDGDRIRSFADMDTNSDGLIGVQDDWVSRVDGALHLVFEEGTITLDGVQFLQMEHFLFA